MKPAEFLKQHHEEIVLYDQVSTGIAQLERVDEVKQIRDKARAVEVYAAQALNYEIETKAAKVRLRAERRCGELLKQSKQDGTRDQGKGGNRKSRSNDATVKLADLGITKQQSSDWQQLAEVPEAKFEARLRAQSGTLKPSTAGLIAKPEPVPPQVPSEVLFIWGRICDFERHDCFEQDPHQVFDLMLDNMQDDVVRIVPQLIPWLQRLVKQGENHGRH